jgi:uncharacterized protein (DUF169 family)
MTHEEMAKALVQEFGLRYDPFAIWMSSTKPDDAYEPPEGERTCVVSMLRVVPLGKVVALKPEAHGCSVAGYYLGFADEPPEGADRYFADGGERLKDSPERARAHFSDARPFPRDEEYCLVARLDTVPGDIEPDVVAVLADADSLSALLMLANYDRDGFDNVIAPFASGCGGLINEPLKEAVSPEPRAVIGLFDVMVRHLVEPDILSFAVPYKRLVEMLANVEKSFMRGPHWPQIVERKQANKKTRRT